MFWCCMNGINGGDEYPLEVTVLNDDLSRLLYDDELPPFEDEAKKKDIYRRFHDSPSRMSSYNEQLISAETTSTSIPSPNQGGIDDGSTPQFWDDTPPEMIVKPINEVEDTTQMSTEATNMLLTTPSQTVLIAGSNTSDGNPCVIVSKPHPEQVDSSTIPMMQVTLSTIPEKLDEGEFEVRSTLIQAAKGGQKPCPNAIPSPFVEAYDKDVEEANKPPPTARDFWSKQKTDAGKPSPMVGVIPNQAKSTNVDGLKTRKQENMTTLITEVTKNEIMVVCDFGRLKASIHPEDDEEVSLRDKAMLLYIFMKGVQFEVDELKNSNATLISACMESAAGSGAFATARTIGAGQNLKFLIKGYYRPLLEHFSSQDARDGKCDTADVIADIERIGRSTIWDSEKPPEHFKRMSFLKDIVCTWSWTRALDMAKANKMEFQSLIASLGDAMDTCRKGGTSYHKVVDVIADRIAA